MRARARDFAYRHVGGTALVLVYHRVTQLERDPQLIAVTPENFDAQMTLLSKRYSVLPLSELATGIGSHHLPDRSVAVTFDDGYADSLLEATPLLERHGVPATVFVSSGFVGGSTEFWWDEIERLVLAPGSLPRSGHLTGGGADLSFDLGEFADYSTEQAESDASWTVLDPPANPRQALYAELCALVRPLSVTQQSALIHQLREAANVAPEPRTNDRQLKPNELVTLDRSPGMRVGGHTRFHTVLSARSITEQRTEIQTDHDALGRICGRSIDSFSYPFGGHGDYTTETVAIVREAGYTHACANHPGVVKPWTDPFRIPRNLVRNWDVATFEAKIAGWFDEPR